MSNKVLFPSKTLICRLHDNHIGGYLEIYDDGTYAYSTYVDNYHVKNFNPSYYTIDGDTLYFKHNLRDGWSEWRNSGELSSKKIIRAVNDYIADKILLG